MIRCVISKDNEWAEYVTVKVQKHNWKLNFAHYKNKRWPMSAINLVKRIFRDVGIKAEWKRSFNVDQKDIKCSWKVTAIYFETESDLSMARLQLPNDFYTKQENT